MSRSKTKPPDRAIPYIDTADKLAPVARRLKAQSLVAFDTEFLWERTYSPRLGLIQVADSESAWVVDPLAISAEQMRPLLDVLVSSDTLKIAHAVDQDQICLHRNYGVVAEPVMDTSVAAALTGMGEQIGLSNLLSKLLRVGLNKGYSRTNWLKRPLPTAMLRYAADDVVHLCKAAGLLIERLRELGREDWALELSAKAGEFAKAHYEPDSLARKLAEGRRLDSSAYSVLRELISWREQEADFLDIPRRWLAEDKVLVKLATARPVTAEQLADFRGLGVSNRPKSAARVLRAIKAGLKAPPDGYKRPTRHKSPTPRESAAVVVLRCFLNALAAEHQIPVRLLVDNGEMVELLRGRFKDVSGLRKSEILDPRVVDLIGDDLVAILSGRRGLRIVDGIATQVDS